MQAMKLNIYLITCSTEASRCGQVVPTARTNELVFIKDRKVFEVVKPREH